MFGASTYTTPFNTTSLKVGLVPALMRTFSKTSPCPVMSVSESMVVVVRSRKIVVSTSGKTGSGTPK